jgi:hypothetical protein
MAYQKTTINFGGTFRFLEQPAKSGQGAENRHFKFCFSNFRLITVGTVMKLRVVIGLDVLYPQ